MSKGKTSINKEEMTFFLIREENRKKFFDNKKGNRDYSDFEMEMTTIAGNAIRGYRSQAFWFKGEYTWYTDKTHTKDESVWMTKDGILMFEKITEKELYRVGFDV